MLHRRQKNLLSDLEWTAMMSLESHSLDFPAQTTANSDGVTSLQAIDLMSRAVIEYSGIKEPDVRAIIARLITNCHALTTPSLDPIGGYLSSEAGLINHSCTPNTHIIYSSRVQIVRSLIPISAGTELTISYIPTNKPKALRQKELRSRYFFSCTCPACTDVSKEGSSTADLDQTITEVSVSSLDPPVFVTNHDSASHELAPRSATTSAQKYPLHCQPNPELREEAFLEATARQDWSSALRHQLFIVIHSDPTSYPLLWHPLRLVHKWVLLRLITQMLIVYHDGGPEAAAFIREFSKVDDTRWRIIVQVLFYEVLSGLCLSHGKSHELTEEVRGWGVEAGMADHEVLGEGEHEVGWGLLKRMLTALEVK